MNGSIPSQTSCIVSDSFTAHEILSGVQPPNTDSMPASKRSRARMKRTRPTEESGKTSTLPSIPSNIESDESRAVQRETVPS
jgi:hypothetical protein